MKENIKLKKCKRGYDVTLTKKIKHPYNSEQWSVICSNCDYVSDKYLTAKEAIQYWNK